MPIGSRSDPARRCRRALATGLIAATLVATSAARVRIPPEEKTAREPSPPVQEEGSSREEAGTSDSWQLEEEGNATAAHASALAALCSFGAAAAACDRDAEMLGARGDDARFNRGENTTADNNATNVTADGTNATVPPAFLYDDLLTANRVLSLTALYREARQLSRAGVVNELDLPRAEKPPGGAILIPGARPTRTILQAAAGTVQLFGLSSTFLAFTPEWAAAQAAFIAATEGEEEDGGEVAEAEDATDDVVGRRRRRRQLLSEQEHQMGEASKHRARRRAMLEEAAARDIDEVMARHDTVPGESSTSPSSNSAAPHSTLEDYVNDVLTDLVAAGSGASAAPARQGEGTGDGEKQLGAGAGFEDGDVGRPIGEANDTVTPRDSLMFEMRRAVKTPGELLALLRSGFWREFGEALPATDREDLLNAMARVRARGMREREGDEDGARERRGDSTSVSNTTSTRASRTEDEDDVERKRENREEKLEDIVRQLSDVEPLFDFEVSVIVRPIFETLFNGVAFRNWNHAAVRLGPQKVTPFFYTDPLALAAVDLIPEVAVAYANSLREMNITDKEIRERLASAVNVRFAVTVVFVMRQQISVNGGDILRNIFTLTL